VSQKINFNELDWVVSEHGNFAAQRKSLSNATGAEKLGASLYQLQPGKKTFPFHCHFNNEEAILIIQGEGTLRLGDKQLAIKQNDYIALPAGEANAHQMINTSEQPLIYLCLSTMNEPDVMAYPDSNKIGLMSGSAPGGKKNANSFKAFYRKDSSVDYFDGEN
jgi:uncharacterized cupin superfamily protein